MSTRLRTRTPRNSKIRCCLADDKIERKKEFCHKSQDVKVGRKNINLLCEHISWKSLRDHELQFETFANNFLGADQKHISDMQCDTNSTESLKSEDSYVESVSSDNDGVDFMGGVQHDYDLESEDSFLLWTVKTCSRTGQVRLQHHTHPDE